MGFSCIDLFVGFVQLWHSCIRIFSYHIMFKLLYKFWHVFPFTYIILIYSHIYVVFILFFISCRILVILLYHIIILYPTLLNLILPKRERTWQIKSIRGRENWEVRWTGYQIWSPAPNHSHDCNWFFFNFFDVTFLWHNIFMRWH